MPRPQKKQKLEDGQTSNDVAADDDNSSSFDRLGTDALANIFGFLRPEDIMRARLNKKMREAAKKTIVPMTEFEVDSVDKYNALVAMSTALPHLQQIEIGHLSRVDKYGDGEDPEEDRAAHGGDRAAYYRRFNPTTHDIEVLIRFRNLRILEIHAPLNGRYPFLFDFPLLQKLSIKNCRYLKFDLEMLAGLPLLKEFDLDCYDGRYDNDFLTGNINSLRVLKDTLAVVHIASPNIEGEFMDLADFPHLRTLNLYGTSVKGDIREIGQRDFLALGPLKLPYTVYGGIGYKFQRISDAPGVVMAVYTIKKQRPSLLMQNWFASLSNDSPDWYDGIGSRDIYESTAPLYIRLVEAGSRVGYRWESANSQHPCEVNWLDPEPDRESTDYEKYIEELHKIERRVHFFRGFHQPPSEEEFHRLELEIGFGQNDE